MSARPDVSMSAPEIDDFLEKSRIAILATNGPGGYPHAAGMWFVVEGGSLQMWTYAKSQKGRNLQRDSRCAVVIEEGERYDELKGVLVRGRARLVTGVEDVARIGRALYERYVEPQTGISYDMGPHSVVESQARKRIGVLLALENVSSWDHAKLGHSGTGYA